MGTQGVPNEKGPSVVDSLGLSWQDKISLSCLDCSSQPSKNILFLTIHFFNSFVLFDQQAGQAVVQGRLSLNMSLSGHHRKKEYNAKASHSRVTAKVSVYGSVCPLMKLMGMVGGEANGVQECNYIYKCLCVKVYTEAVISF
jgi:hypothetical protein